MTQGTLLPVSEPQASEQIQNGPEEMRGLACTPTGWNCASIVTAHPAKLNSTAIREIARLTGKNMR